MTEKMIAMCGIVCTDCGAYIATQKNDNKLRKEVADKWNKAPWSKKYDREFTPEDINCDGCLSERANPGCEIRKCGRGKGVLNCAYCSEYACDRLDKYFQSAPAAKKTLDGIKQGVN
jgi:hypothetical protein